MRIKILAAFALGTLLAPAVLAQSAKDVRGASPYIAQEDEPEPRLIVDQPIAGSLAAGFVQIQYRTENLHIVPVFGAGARGASPRIGHLHVTVDDLPWHWADASDHNTVDIVGLASGPHKVLIELVNSEHQVFPGQSALVTFTVPDKMK